MGYHAMTPRYPHTPILFLEDVRRCIIDNNPHLTEHELDLLARVPIMYKALAQSKYIIIDHMEAMEENRAPHTLEYGMTEQYPVMLSPYAKDVMIFGMEHLGNAGGNGQKAKHMMAFSMVHEFAHIITPQRPNDGGGHSEEWAHNCARLGIYEVPYGVSKDGGHPEKPENMQWLFTDKKLEHFVDAYPLLSWGDMAKEMVAEGADMVEREQARLRHDNSYDD